MTFKGKEVFVTQTANSRVVFAGSFAARIKRDSLYLPASNRLAVLTDDYKCCIVDLNANARFPVGKANEQIITCSASDDGKHLLVATSAGRCFAVAPPLGAELWSHQHQHPLDDMDVLENGSEHVLVDSSGTVSVWKPGDDAPRLKLAAKADGANRVRYIADDTMILTWNVVNGEFVRCWEADTGQLVAEVEASGLLEVSDHSTHPLIAIGSHTRARIWNVRTNETIELTQEECLGVAVSGNSVAVLSRSSNQTNMKCSLSVYPLAGGEPTMQESFPLTTSRLATGKTGDTLAIGQYGYCADIFDVQSGQYVVHSALHPRPLVTAAFSLDSTRLVTVSEDGGINVCDIDGKVIHSGRNPNGPIRAAATDRAGQVLLTAGDNGELLLWNTSGVSQVAALAVC